MNDPKWRAKVLQDAFGQSFWGFFAVAVATGVACYWLNGKDAFAHALDRDLGLLADLLPRVIVALTIAALIWGILPRDRVSGLVGRNSGLAGLAIATLAGAITPGGPASAYAFLAVMGASGADRGAMVAYITSWGMLGLQRVLVWDVPFMGTEFALMRLAVCLPLPIVAGLIARKLPFTLTLKDQTESQAGRP